MRPRLKRPQLVKVRRLVPSSGDVFGDAPIVASDNRDAAFDMKMQLTWTSGVVSSDGNPGRGEQRVVFALALKRDVPKAANGWVPAKNDLIELPSGDKLFVSSVEPAFPRRISLGNPRGGFDGWRMNLSDSSPTMSAATEYDS